MRKGLLLAAAALALSAPPAHASPTFWPGSSTSVGFYHEAATGDVDGDGNRDVVMAARPITGPGSIRIGRATPGGPDWGAPIPIARFLAAPVVADLDGDGRADISIADRFAGSITVLRATALGFERTDHSVAAALSGELAAGDFDGDGAAELVVGTDTGVDLLGLTAGGALELRRAGVMGPGASAVLARDIDGDGHADLVAGGASGITVLTAAGSTRYPVDGFVISLAAGDLDGDGRLDIGAALSQPGGVVSWRGRGDGTFERRPLHPFETDPRGLVADDLDGDGLDDLATMHAPRMQVHVLLGQTRGDLVRAPVQTPLERGGWVATASADVDLDGRADLVAVNPFNATAVHVLSNRSPRLTVSVPSRSSTRVVDVSWETFFGVEVARLELWSGVGKRIATLANPGRSGVVPYEFDRDGRHQVTAVAYDTAGRTLEPPPVAEVDIDTATTFDVETTGLGRVVVGRAGAPATQRVRNTGEVPLRVDSVTLVGTTEFELAADHCTGTIVAPGEACALDVRLTPALLGTRGATVMVAANTRTPPRFVRLEGEGIVEPPAPEPVEIPIPRVTPTPSLVEATKLRFDAAPGRTRTRLRRLRLEHVAPGSTVTVRCVKGCAARSYTKRGAAGTVSLARFASRRLAAGTTIRVTLAAPGQPARTATLKIRARRAPLVSGAL